MWFSLQKSISLKKKKRRGEAELTQPLFCISGKANPVCLSLQKVAKPFHPVISCKHSAAFWEQASVSRLPLKPFS